MYISVNTTTITRIQNNKKQRKYDLKLKQTTN